MDLNQLNQRFGLPGVLVFHATAGGLTYASITTPQATATVYLQDAWKLGTRYQLDYGLRGDSFLVSSTGFGVGFGQLSPRVKLTRFFGARDSVYAYYGRFFTPFSLENVSPAAAFELDRPLQRGLAGFDLKPQRDSVYELGGHVALGRGDLGLRVMQKNAADLIDDTQVGTTNLHIYAAMRGETLEAFQKTRNTKALYSVAGQEGARNLTWDKASDNRR